MVFVGETCSVVVMIANKPKWEEKNLTLSPITTHMQFTRLEALLPLLERDAPKSSSHSENVDNHRHDALVKMVEKLQQEVQSITSEVHDLRQNPAPFASLGAKESTSAEEPASHTVCFL